MTLSSSSVSEVKRLIQEKEDIPPDQKPLRFKGYNLPKIKILKTTALPPGTFLRQQQQSQNTAPPPPAAAAAAASASGAAPAAAAAVSAAAIPSAAGRLPALSLKEAASLIEKSADFPVSAEKKSAIETIEKHSEDIIADQREAPLRRMDSLGYRDYGDDDDPDAYHLSDEDDDRVSHGPGLREPTDIDRANAAVFGSYRAPRYYKESNGERFHGDIDLCTGRCKRCHKNISSCVCASDDDDDDDDDENEL